MNRLLFKLYRLPIPWIVRYNVSRLLSLFKPSTQNEINSDVDPDGSGIRKLKKEGFIIIPDFLTEDKINSLIESLSSHKVIDPWNSAQEEFFPSEPPAGAHVGYYSKKHLDAIPLVNEIVEDPLINYYVSNYVGKNYQCTNRASWWTFGNNTNPQEAELLHRDIDNILWLKVFIYLTDVESDCGPHVFIPGSHRINKFLTFKRFSDEEAREQFGDLAYHKGKKGTLIIEDTFGLHKGQHIIVNKNRLIFQLQFSILDNPYKAS